MKALILAHLATVLSASSTAETLFTPAQNVPADGLPDRASAIAIKLWLVQRELGVMQMPTSPMPRIACMSCFSSCLVLGSNLELKLKMWGFLHCCFSMFKAWSKNPVCSSTSLDHKG
jgi:hypothetical protein